MLMAFESARVIPDTFSARTSAPPIDKGRLYEKSVKYTLMTSINLGTQLQYTLYELSRSRRKPNSEEINTKKVNMASKFESISIKDGTSITSHENVLYFPISKTQESIDFVQPPYLFQVTMADSHKVSSKGLEVAMKYFSKDRNYDWNLVFVIPAKRKDRFHKQDTGSLDMTQFCLVIDYPENFEAECDYDFMTIS